MQLLMIASLLIVRSSILPPAVNLAGILIQLTGYAVVVPSAVRLAREVRHNYTLTKWNRWYAYAAFF
jgi:xanthosine utilization system XapX-like protein